MKILDKIKARYEQMSDRAVTIWVSVYLGVTFLIFSFLEGNYGWLVWLLHATALRYYCAYWRQVNAWVLRKWRKDF